MKVEFTLPKSIISIYSSFSMSLCFLSNNLLMRLDTTAIPMIVNGIIVKMKIVCPNVIHYASTHLSFSHFGWTKP